VTIGLHPGAVLESQASLDQADLDGLMMTGNLPPGAAALVSQASLDQADLMTGPPMIGHHLPGAVEVDGTALASLVRAVEVDGAALASLVRVGEDLVGAPHSHGAQDGYGCHQVERGARADLKDLTTGAVAGRVANPRARREDLVGV
jgi:hypothetical protein